MNYFITAIGTDSGKTLVSAIVAHALNADYWKPIQAGTPTDTNTIKSLMPDVRCHKEAFALKTPASPHYAADQDGINIELGDIKIPKSNSNIVIEGAGGVMVPLNKENYVIDIATLGDMEIILVSNNYLGSINHTLLTLNYLTARRFKIKGIIFNGPKNESTEEIILHHAKLPCLLRIPELEEINASIIKDLASKLEL